MSLNREKAREQEKERRKKVFSAAEGLESDKAVNDFRVVTTGKGGAGKTTLTALLAQFFAEDEYQVLAVDEDPSKILPFPWVFQKKRLTR